MKRTLFIILILITTNVSAMEYSEFQEEKIEKTDSIEVDIERRYLFYKNVVNNGGYYPIGEHLVDYPMMDENDYKYSDFTIWGDREPYDLENREIETKTIYNYQDMKEIRYIFLTDIDGFYNGIKFIEIEIYINDQRVDYVATCTSCSVDLISKLNNQIIVGELYQQVYRNGSIKIDLQNYYPSASINMRVVIYDPSTPPKTYTVTFTHEDDINDNYYEKDVSNNYRSMHADDKYVDVINYRNMYMMNPQYYEVIYSEEYVEHSIDREVTEVKLYRYRDKLFNYYCYEPIYSDIYMTSPTVEYPFIDLEKYKDYYRYKEIAVVEEIKPLIPTKETKLTIKKPIEVTEEPVEEIIVKPGIEASFVDIEKDNQVFKNIFIPFVGFLVLLIILYVKREYKNIKL
jgi:hypothetical protein